MKALLTAIPAVAAIVLLAVAVPATAAPRKWYWSESRAQSLVIAKVHVPCRTVWPSPRSGRWGGPQPACDLAAAQAYYAKNAAQANDPAACDAFLTDKTACHVALAAAVSRAGAALRHARDGYTLSNAVCHGTAPDVSFRFAKFICDVTVEDVARAQLGIIVTGAATFRWEVI